MGSRNKTIIHIGYHKCASTSLQKDIFPNLKINYFSTWGIHAETKYREYLDMLQNKKIDIDFFRKIVSKYSGNKYDLTLISHEDLSGHISGYKDNDPFITADNLYKAYPEAKILIIIREQLSYIKSLYAFKTTIQGYETRDFACFVEDESKKGLVEKLKYNKLIEYYYKLFSKENVLVLPLEGIKEKELFFGEIVEFIGAESISKQLSVSSHKNFSFYEKNCIDLSLWFNKFFLAIYNIFKVMNKSAWLDIRFRYLFYRLRVLILRLMQKCLLGNSKKLNCAGLEDLKAVFEEDNKSLEKLCNISLKKFNYY